MDHHAKAGSILFVFGSARGGTTFLSKLLGTWFSYGMGPEGTFVEDIVSKALTLGDLGDDRVCRQLAEAILATTTFQIIQKRWRDEIRFDVTPEEIMERMPDRSVASAIYAAFKVIADKHGKTRVGNKNPGYWRQLETLSELFPNNAKYLFIVRDGRDVALSLKNVPWGGHSVFEAAHIWLEMIATVNKFKKKAKPGALLTIKYEDLLSTPGKIISELGQFLGEENIDSIRTQYENAAAASPKKNNFGKWEKGMSVSDQKMFEAIAGDALSEFGYKRNYPGAKLRLGQKWLAQLQRVRRLVKLNIYKLQSKLPLDAKKSKKNWIIELVRPGRLK